MHNLSAHARCRRLVECAWGLLKNRFPCLRDNLRLKSPLECARVIRCCAHLHNFLIDTKPVDDPPFDDHLVEEEEEDETDEEEAEEEVAQQQIATPFANNRLRQLYQSFISANNL